MNLQQKKAFVTGAGAGIGAALARELAARGASVTVVDVDAAAAQSVAAEIGGVALTLDVTDVPAVEAAAKAVWEREGGVDLVFANAGVMAAGPVMDGTAEVFDWIYKVNQRGVWATCQAFAKLMIAADRPGRLAMTGSEHSLGGQHAGVGLYTASKHAVLGLAEIMRLELPESIGVSVFCPGLVETRLHEADRFGVAPPAPPEMKAVAAEVNRRGMPAAEAAKKAIDGIERGDFFIVTHPNSYAAAERRFNEIKAAYDAQAPATGDVSKYAVDAVIGRVMQDLGGSS